MVRVCNWIVVSSLIFTFDQVLSAPIIELARVGSEYIFVCMVGTLLIGDLTNTNLTVPGLVHWENLLTLWVTLFPHGYI